MRKRIFFLLFVALMASGCSTLSSPSGNPSESLSSESSTLVERKLSIASSPKTDYEQYDRLDLTGLAVHADTYQDGALISSEVFSDFTLSIDGNPVQEAERLDYAGEKEVVVSAEGYVSTSFSITLSPKANLRQSLEITALPNLSYAPGERFSLKGLVLTLQTIYYDVDGNRIVSDETVDDYSATIDGRQAEGYVLEDVRSYAVSISYEGYVRTLSTSFSCYVLSQDVDEPQVFDDETIKMGEDQTEMTVSFKTGDASGKGYYAPEEVDIPFTMEDYGHANYLDEVKMPSKGKIPMLVVPVVYPGYESMADGDNMALIQKAFFGSSADMEFESLHSYYYKASRGQLDITGMVTDYFRPSLSSLSSLDDQENLYDLADEALDWVEETYAPLGFDKKDYDSDGDGVIDGLWLVYLYPSKSSSHLYSWAVTTSTGDVGTVDDPVVNTFGYAGISFLKGEESNKECDAHTLIHETGHMLGLNDYYSYNNAKSGYAPLGGADMMDHNVGDMNPYSKMLLGWTKPYVVTGDCTITLPSSQSEDMPPIVFAEDGKDYPVVDGRLQFNIFDEYLVLDLYSPLNLNAAGYPDYDIAMPEKTGGRLYHVDNRLGIMGTTAQGEKTLTLPEDPLAPLQEENEGNIYRAFYNTEAGNNSEQSYFTNDSRYNRFDEIRWIAADRKLYASNENVPDDNFLFSVGSTFSLADYLSQFNAGGLDNGKTMATTFTIQAIE